MSKVNVTLREFFTSPGNVPVTVRSVLIAGQNVLSGTNGVLPGEDTQRTNAAGVKQFDLMTGRYLVSAKSSKAGSLVYAVYIDVPDDNATYEHTQLIVEGAEPFTQPIAVAGNATDSNYGLVKLMRNGVAPRATVGVWHVNDVAALKAIVTDASNIFATLIKRQPGEPPFFYWDGARNDADDPVGFTVVRPNDFVSAGSMGVWVQTNL